MRVSIGMRMAGVGLVWGLALGGAGGALLVYCERAPGAMGIVIGAVAIVTGTAVLALGWAPPALARARRATTWALGAAAVAIPIQVAGLFEIDTDHVSAFPATVSLLLAGGAHIAALAVVGADLTRAGARPTFVTGAAALVLEAAVGWCAWAVVTIPARVSDPEEPYTEWAVARGLSMLLALALIMASAIALAAARRAISAG